MFTMEEVTKQADEHARKFLRDEFGDEYDEDHEFLRFSRVSVVPRRIKTHWDPQSRRWFWYWSRIDEDDAPLVSAPHDEWQWTDDGTGAWIPAHAKPLRLITRAKALNEPPRRVL